MNTIQTESGTMNDELSFTVTVIPEVPSENFRQKAQPYDREKQAAALRKIAAAEDRLRKAQENAEQLAAAGMGHLAMGPVSLDITSKKEICELAFDIEMAELENMYGDTCGKFIVDNIVNLRPFFTCNPVQFIASIINEKLDYRLQETRDTLDNTVNYKTNYEYLMQVAIRLMRRSNSVQFTAVQRVALDSIVKAALEIVNFNLLKTKKRLAQQNSLQKCNDGLTHFIFMKIAAVHDFSITYNPNLTTYIHSIIHNREELVYYAGGAMDETQVRLANTVAREVNRDPVYSAVAKDLVAASYFTDSFDSLLVQKDTDEDGYLESSIHYYAKDQSDEPPAELSKEALKLHKMLCDSSVPRREVLFYLANLPTFTAVKEFLDVVKNGELQRVFGAYTKNYKKKLFTKYRGASKRYSEFVKIAEMYANSEVDAEQLRALYEKLNTAFNFDSTPLVIRGSQIDLL